MNKKTEKFHEMKNDELTAELKELKEKLFRLRFSHATGQLSNPLEMSHCKKDIARVKTILHARELKATANGGQPAVVADTKVKATKATAATSAKKAKA